MGQAERDAASGPDVSGDSPLSRPVLLLKLQSTAANILAGALSLEEAPPRLIEAICRNLNWEFGALWTVGPERDVLRCQSTWRVPSFAAHGFERITRQRTFEIGEDLPGRIWMSGNPAWITDATRDPNFPRAEVALEEGLHGALGFPIKSDDHFFGVMEFFSHRILPPDEQLLTFMEGIGSQIGHLYKRLNAQEAMRQSEARKAAMLEGSLDCIVSIDHRGILTEFNPAAERTFGYRREDVIGRPMAEVLIPAALRDQHRRGLAHYLATGEGPMLRKRVELPALRANGEEFPTEIAIIPFRSNGVHHFTAYIRDITDRKTAEAESERTSKFREQLLAILGHDLRNPLQAIKMATELLFRCGDLNERQSKTVARISTSSDRMSRMIEDLLDVARVEAGRLSVHAQPAVLQHDRGQELRAVRREVLRGQRAAGRARGLRQEFRQLAAVEGLTLERHPDARGCKE